MLELFDNDYKGTIIKMFQKSMTSSPEKMGGGKEQ